MSRTSVLTGRRSPLMLPRGTRREDSLPGLGGPGRVLGQPHPLMRLKAARGATAPRYPRAASLPCPRAAGLPARPLLTGTGRP